MAQYVCRGNFPKQRPWHINMEQIVLAHMEEGMSFNLIGSINNAKAFAAFTNKSF